MIDPLDDADWTWIEQWRQSFLDAGALVLVDLHQANAQAMGRFRREIAALGGRVVAVRNRRARALVRDTPLAAMEGAFVGPTAVVLASRSLGAVRGVLRQLGTFGPPTLPDGASVRSVWVRGAEIRLGALADEPPPRGPLPAVFEDGVLVVSAAELRATSQALRRWMQAPELPRCEVDETSALRLDHHGPNKIQVAHLVRRILGCTVPEAWALVHAAPVYLPLSETTIYRGELGAIAAELRAAGAEITLRHAAPSRHEIEVDVDDELFAALGHVRLREDHRLRARVHVSFGGSHSWVWAESLAGIPIPVGAALIGDGTLQSYVEASLLLRELGDFAAGWHGISWRAHEIVDTPGPGAWTWTEGLAREDLRPRARRGDDDTVEVTLCTECSLVEEQLTAFVDRYGPASMEPSSEAVRLATGGPGYIF